MGKLLQDNVIDSINPTSKGTILRSMAIFTTIELCGSFLTGKTNQGTTTENFKAFCESKYMDSIYHDKSDLLLSIFRNGVSHSYIPKGCALLSSDTREENNHLKFYSEGLSIYIPKLAEDVTNAIQKYLVDLKNDNKLKENYKSVIEQLDKEGDDKYKKFLEEHNIKTEKENRGVVRDIKLDID